MNAGVNRVRGRSCVQRDLLALALLGTLGACGSQSSQSPAHEAAPFVAGDGQVHRAATGKLAPLNGVWKTPCLNGPTRQPTVRALVVSEAGVEYLSREFDDTACERELKSLSFKYSPGEVNVFDRQGGQAFDIPATVRSITLTPRSGYSALANLNLLCGRHDWLDERGTELSGAQCGQAAYPAQGSTLSLFIELGDGYLSFAGQKYRR